MMGYMASAASQLRQAGSDDITAGTPSAEGAEGRAAHHDALEAQIAAALASSLPGPDSVAGAPGGSGSAGPDNAAPDSAAQDRAAATQAADEQQAQGAVGTSTTAPGTGYISSQSPASSVNIAWSSMACITAPKKTSGGPAPQVYFGVYFQPASRQSKYSLAIVLYTVVY